MLFSRRRTTLVPADEALPGHPEPLFPVPERHEVLGTPLQPGPDGWPAGLEVAYFAMGCFWGAERIFWQLPGVHSTAVGYQGGYSPHPTYDEVCGAATGHAEVVQVVYDPAKVSYDTLLKHFWENHDPTQGMRQGNDVGTQYRSAVWTTGDEQARAAEASRERYQAALTAAGFDTITTEVGPAGPFYYAEPFHQQYLHKNPGGYCNHGFCQVAYEGQEVTRVELPGS